MARKIAEPVSPCPTFTEWLDCQPEQDRNKLHRYKDRLLALFKEPRRGDIRWQYAVGQAVLRLFPADDRHRGQNCMEMIGDLVEPGRNRAEKSIITWLYNWRSMAIRCSPEEVADLAAKVRRGQLTPQHVTSLVTVIAESNTRTRAQFLRECLKHGWTANQLRREIQDDRKHLTSFGGRHSRPRTTSSPALAARQIIVLSRQWQACHEQYFEGRSAPLAKIPKECSPRLRRELEEALDGLRRVAKSASQARKTLVRIVGRLSETAALHRSPAKQQPRSGSGRRRKREPLYSFDGTND